MLQFVIYLEQKLTGGNNKIKTWRDQVLDHYRIKNKIYHMMELSVIDVEQMAAQQFSSDPASAGSLEKWPYHTHMQYNH